MRSFTPLICPLSLRQLRGYLSTPRGKKSDLVFLFVGSRGSERETVSARLRGAETADLGVAIAGDAAPAGGATADGDAGVAGQRVGSAGLVVGRLAAGAESRSCNCG